jgi:selenocysteine lyase/cysteine desulfurase
MADVANDLDVQRLRADTPGCERRIHFNNAGASMMPRPVLEAMVEHLELEAEIGGYEAADARAAEIEGFYPAVAGLLGCRPENVAFAVNATDAYARALSSVPFERGDVILTTRDDYISNQIQFFSLRRRLGVEVVHAPNAPGGGVDVDALEGLARERRPRLVAVTHVPTSSGLVQPVEEVGRVCRELDLLYLVDGCQSAGQLPLDVQAIGCDFLSATSRKFLRGPRGAGFLYVGDRALQAGYEPLFLDMRGADWTGEGYEQFSTAKRFEDWEFPYAALLATAAATRYALELGIDAISARALGLAEQLRQRLEEAGLRVLDLGRRRCAIVTVAIPGRDGEAFHAALERRGINSSVSDIDSARFDFADKGVEWALRLSPHAFNTEDEVETVAAEVAALAGSTVPG